jgi:hypothetical protein
LAGAFSGRSLARRWRSSAWSRFSRAAGGHTRKSEDSSEVLLVR